MRESISTLVYTLHTVPGCKYRRLILLQTNLQHNAVCRRESNLYYMSVLSQVGNPKPLICLFYIVYKALEQLQFLYSSG